MKHIFSALCGRVLVDQITQGVTMVDLTDSILGPVDPNSEGAFGIALDFLSVWLRDDLAIQEVGRGRVGVLDAAGNLLHPHVEYEVDLTVSMKARNITKFPGFPFRGIGMHKVIVDVESAGGWVPAGEWPVFISNLPGAVATAAIAS